MKKQLILFFLCALLTTQAQAQKKFAMLIGVDYKKPVPRLNYTTQDAIKLGEVLERNFGYKVKILTTPQQTTRDRIIKEFSNLKKNSHNYDQVIVFFSGHGEPDKGSGRVGYLLPYDVDINDYLSSAIDMSIIQNISITLKSKQVLFILDCCYSGIIGSYQNMDLSFSDHKKAKVSKTRKSRQILTAGLSNQTARIYPELKMSVYTHFLIKALSYDAGYLGADSYGDGEVNLWGLQSYVRNKVSAFTKKAQTPGMYNYTNNDGIFLFKGEKSSGLDVTASTFFINKSSTIENVTELKTNPNNYNRDINPRQTIINSQQAKQKLLGEHLFALQWISWDYFGKVTITENNNLLYIKGEQKSRNGVDFLKIDGLVTTVDAKEFQFEGTVTTKVNYINSGKPCVRKGLQTFKITNNRKYWRMQQMENPCDSATDYVDIFF